MARIRSVEEKIGLSEIDRRVLTALLLGPASGYQVARQCEADGEHNGLPAISNGTIFPALKRLKQFSLVEQSGDKARHYLITALGREVLGWELEALNGSLQLARERLRRTVRK